MKIKEQNKKRRMQGGGVAFDIGESIPRSGFGGMFTGFFEDALKKEGQLKSSKGLDKGVAKSNPRSGFMRTGFFEDVFKKQGLGKSSKGLGKGVAKSKSISQDLAQRGQRPMRGVNT